MNSLATAFGRAGGRMGQGQGFGDRGGSGQGVPQGPGPGFPDGGGQGFGAPGAGRGFGHMAQGFGPAGGIGPIVGMFGLLVWVGVLTLIVVAFWQIFQKSGHPGAMGLLMLIPFVNLGALLYLAFSEWPVFQKDPGAAVAAPPVTQNAGPAVPAADTAPLPAQPAPAQADQAEEPPVTPPAGGAS
jgi:hypothetical protein